jgi:hypothetical protein
MPPSHNQEALISRARFKDFQDCLRYRVRETDVELGERAVVDDALTPAGS